MAKTDMLTTAFVPLLKAEELDDGTLIVFGKATGPDLDLDQQICDPAWLSEAMPEWMQWGNVREQHSSIAAGVGIDLSADGDDWWLRTHVVDSGSCQKVTAKVLKGYSIGIRDAKVVRDQAAPGGRIVAGTIVEVSLVDRPANPTCSLTMSKSLGTGQPEWILKEDPTMTTTTTLKDANDVKDMPAPATGTGEVGPGEVESPADIATEADLVAQARAALAALLASEAAEVGAGSGTTTPVRILTYLLDDLDWYVMCDAWEDDMESLSAGKAAKGETVKLSALADLVKAATPEDVAALDTIAKGLGLTEIRESVATLKTTADEALTKATTAQEAAEEASQETAKVRDELDTVKNTVDPNGPHRTRTTSDLAKAEQFERETKAARFKALADTVDDPRLRDGYVTLAERALAGLPTD